MMIDFLKYCLWATIQHLLILSPFFIASHFFSYAQSVESTLIAILLFSFVAHNGNALLSVLCFILSAVFYPVLLLTEYFLIGGVTLILIHTLSGIFLKIRGVDMRVWRF